MSREDSPRYLPRKGTETHSQIYAAKTHNLGIRHDIYPARGRKLCCVGIIWKNLSYSPRYLPRKGTETSSFDTNTFIYFSSFATIFTPQGDGNRDLPIAIAPKTRNSPRYLPRKGTETCCLVHLCSWECCQFATIFTPQGDGNCKLF